MGQNAITKDGLEEIAGLFKGFVDRCVRHFQVFRYDTAFHAHLYPQGRYQCGDRKNMERMEEVVPVTDYQALQQFIRSLLWAAQDVTVETLLRASELIGDPKDACLIIDETSFLKKGKKTVGGAGQYLGCAGKVDNCHVGIFTALCKDSHVALLNGRVYLSQEWVNDLARCSAAKIPEDERDFGTKDTLAL